MEAKPLLRALSAPSRRAILDLLRDGERPAGEIAEAVGLSTVAKASSRGLSEKDSPPCDICIRDERPSPTDVAVPFHIPTHVIPSSLRLTAALALAALASVSTTAQVVPSTSDPVTNVSEATVPLTAYAPGVGLRLDPRQRPAGIGDVALLTLGGVGGGLATAVLVSAADPAPAIGAAAYGLGVAAGTTLTGRVLRIDGSPIGALLGAAVGSGIVLLVADDADDDGDDIGDIGTVALAALVLPPVLSTAGYVLTPTLMGDRSPGLTLRVDL